MNIYLIPYTFSRHLVLALPLAAAGSLAWCWTLTWIVGVGPVAHDLGWHWSQRCEGAHYLGNVSAAVAFASLAVEGSIRRRPLRYRFGYAALAGAIAWALTVMAYAVWLPLGPWLGSTELRPVLADPALVSLRTRIGMWASAGVASGVGPLLARWLATWLARRFGRGADLVRPRAPATWAQVAAQAYHHAAGGLVAGLMGAAVWHAFGHYPWLAGDLYLAGALGPMVWGGLHGVLVVGVADELYAGWVRVLTRDRFGLRIPVPPLERAAAERFVGHFPRGLDLYLPAERGVAELHASFVVDADGRYAVRGLSVDPTVVTRFLERVDLQYDPRRPAPLETDLRMEDTIVLGPRGEVVLEFLMLPREER